MNTVQLIGRTTADIDLRYTQSGKAVGRFTLAVNRQKKDDGADFITCQVWGATAENMNKYVHKGNKVAVIGRIRTGSYEKNGQKFYTTDVVASEVEFLEPPKQQNRPAYNDAPTQDYYDTGYSEVDDTVPWE